MQFAGKAILLDIEGTTSSISFVHDVMFPFVRVRLNEFLTRTFADASTRKACDRIAIDAGFESLADWQAKSNATQPSDAIQLVVAEVTRLMDGDVKATGLKELQGLIWDSGFRSGELRSHVYADVLPAITRWRASGIDVRIYSSGSIAAQKLFFGHVDQVGDCLNLFSGHYDTTIGSKRELASYSKIAADWGKQPTDILFVSDLAPEIEAASAAGLKVATSVRPGNAALPSDWSQPVIRSFDEIQV